MSAGQLPLGRVLTPTSGRREVTEAYIRQIDAEGMFRQPIATTVEPLTGFYEGGRAITRTYAEQ